MVEDMGLWWRVWNYGGGYGTMVEGIVLEKGEWGGGFIYSLIRNDITMLSSIVMI